MDIHTLALHPYTVPLTNGQIRSGVLINIVDAQGNSGWGDIAPLPRWSKETLDDAFTQLDQKQDQIIKITWAAHTCFKELEKLNLFPSVSFGLESALLALLAPLPEHTVVTSALFMGSVPEILMQAKLRQAEGYTSAKLKVSNLSFEDAEYVTNELKHLFRLRIDVNRAWPKEDSLRFFAKFPFDTFDYVEEPFQNPHDLAEFSHPLAVDESYPQDLSLEQLNSLPALKAIIYKPTLQGGMLGCLALREWARKRELTLVLSGSFESDVGVVNVASLARRLSLSAPVGVGTYHYLGNYLAAPLQFSGFLMHMPAQIMMQSAALQPGCIIAKNLI